MAGPSPLSCAFLAASWMTLGALAFPASAQTAAPAPAPQGSVEQVPAPESGLVAPAPSPAPTPSAIAPASSTEALPPKQVAWSFNGPFGTYDRAALQRGFQVYKEVCSACHSVRYLYFRDLTALGYSEDQVKGIAAAWPQQITDGPDDTGQMFQRPARPSDRIPGPFP